MNLKIKKQIFFLLISLNLFACKGIGFYEPITLNLEVPPGPPEYQAGWRAGCRSGLATKPFANSFVYNADFGNGIYQHDPNFIKGWGNGWFGCIMHTANFVGMPSMQYGPLQ